MNTLLETAWHDEASDIPVEDGFFDRVKEATKRDEGGYDLRKAKTLLHKAAVLYRKQWEVLIFETLEQKREKLSLLQKQGERKCRDPGWLHSAEGSAHWNEIKHLREKIARLEKKQQLDAATLKRMQKERSLFFSWEKKWEKIALAGKESKETPFFLFYALFLQKAMVDNMDTKREELSGRHTLPPLRLNGDFFDAHVNK